MQPCLAELFLLSQQFQVFLIYSTDFKDEANLMEKVLGTANWLISRTHPLIHLQLRSPFLKPQSAEQCLKELSSALETVLGIGGSCWLICGRELLLQAEGDCIHKLGTRGTAEVFLLEGSQCLSGACYHRHMPRNPFEFFLSWCVWQNQKREMQEPHANASFQNQIGKDSAFYMDLLKD